MYCGGCFRDNALVGALRKLGHSTLMVPLYLPLTLDEEDNSVGTPIFYGGINVYLEEKSALFRKTPRWLHKLLDSPRLLKWASGSAAKTRPQDVGALTLSMIKGEEGNQKRELDELTAWLSTHERPDVVCLSNALLIGLARGLKQTLQVPVACLLTGEDYFLDSLPSNHRQVVWETLAKRAREIDLFVAPSSYYRDLMIRRLKLSPERVRIVYNGINLDGYDAHAAPPSAPVLGYFARMCKEKGLELFAEAAILLKQRSSAKHLRLRIGGGLGPSDKPLVDSIRRRFEQAGFGADVEFCPNLDRKSKQDFFRSLSIFSTPALYGEAFGLYLIEALAAGVPVVQPRHGAFPELVEATGGGLICEPNAAALANAAEELLVDPGRARTLGKAGQSAVTEQFSIEGMAENLIQAYRELKPRSAPVLATPHSAF
ncbi:MAG: glycosyltransferase family 4 protein [Verrucomicrobia bacterium]|nr:glycosyltransferase family 4 protein [Verrucomicrobiota bacterium]